jgi:type IV pilus assembly protein PilA
MKTKKGFTLVEIMIVVVIIAMLAAMAVPGWQKIRKQAQDKTIANNLRQLSAAAQQYFLENGAAQAVYTNLVGTESTKYIKTIEVVAEEDYAGLTINAGDTQIFVTKSDGTVIYYYP